MIAGACLVLAVGAYGLSDPKPVPVEAALQVSPAYQDVPQQSVMPEIAQSPGTVCETPNGSVCTVAPQPINSRCQCSGGYGRIVR
jgi:hypothetical protein